jgi:hypothetical protein
MVLDADEQVPARVSQPGVGKRHAPSSIDLLAAQMNLNREIWHRRGRRRARQDVDVAQRVERHTPGVSHGVPDERG